MKQNHYNTLCKSHMDSASLQTLSRSGSQAPCRGITTCVFKEYLFCLLEATGCKVNDASNSDILKWSHKAKGENPELTGRWKIVCWGLKTHSKDEANCKVSSCPWNTEEEKRELQWPPVTALVGSGPTGKKERLFNKIKMLYFVTKIFICVWLTVHKIWSHTQRGARGLMYHS